MGSKEQLENLSRKTDALLQRMLTHMGMKDLSQDSSQSKSASENDNHNLHLRFRDSIVEDDKEAQLNATAEELGGMAADMECDGHLYPSSMSLPPAHRTPGGDFRQRKVSVP